jgi:hypothetical protein
MTTAVKIIRHEVPDAMVCDLGPDHFRMDDLLTAECGAVSGSIVRHVDDADGIRDVLYEARIDGSDETCGFSRWCAETLTNLTELGAVFTQGVRGRVAGVGEAMCEPSLDYLLKQLADRRPPHFAEGGTNKAPVLCRSISAMKAPTRGPATMALSWVCVQGTD